MVLDIIAKDDIKARTKTIPKDRACAKCGGNYTQKDKNGNAAWGKHYDKDGKWFKNQYICSLCRGIESYEGRKSVTNVRINNLDLNSNLAKSIISESIVAKVLGIENLNINNDNYEWFIDLEHDIYGKIDVKSSTLQDYGRWHWYPTRKNPQKGRNKKQILCDTFICIGYDYKRNDVDVVLIIPSEYGNVSTINYNKNSKRGNKYGSFIVGEIPYNDAYNSLMMYIKGMKFFGVDIIKEWMNL